MPLRVSLVASLIVLTTLTACGAGEKGGRHDDGSSQSPPRANATSTTAPTKKKATTPAELRQQTKLCDELFSPKLKSPTGTHAMDLIYDYFQSDPQRPSLNVKEAKAVGDDLREVSTRAPEWLAPHVTAMADDLDLLLKLAADGKSADDISAATFNDLVAGGKATLAICLPPGTSQ